MKSQASKICGHMVRGARINERITRSGVMDYSVGIGCSEDGALSSGKGGWKRRRSRGG